MQSLKIDLDQLVNWFNVIRNLPDHASRSRSLEAFWDTQIASKSWLVTTLNEFITEPSNVYIFGGWIGVLANLIFQCSSWPVKNIRSIDLDPWCENLANNLNSNYLENLQFKAVTADMCDYNYEFDLPPDVVINTSTEHVNQETYDRWYDRIYPGSIILLQGNNFFNCHEHIRCSHNLEEFKRMNYANNVLYEGSLANPLYTRYMVIFKK